MYCDLTGEELKFLDVDCPRNWKEVVEIVVDTEGSIRDWSAEEKKLFRLGARSFYIKSASYLLSRLPFDSGVLKDLGCLDLSSTQEESSAVAFRNLAQQVSQVIAPKEVSALMDEFALISSEVLCIDPHERLDSTWQRVFSLQNKNGGIKYPLVGKLVNALLSLSHGNADVERGFSKNRRILQERSKLSIESVNGLYAIQSFAKRYDKNIPTIPVKRDMLIAVKQS